MAKQAREIDDLAQHDGLAVVADYTDNDTSASTRSTKPRPEYDRMVADAKAGKFSVILAYSASRLTRRPREHEDLIELAERYGVTFRYVKSPSFDLNSADGRQVARMLAAADAAEAERTAERVQLDVKRRAEAGEFHGGPRGYGIADGGRDLVEAEADRVREWASRVLAGDALRLLAREANKASVPTKSGATTWSARVIRGILIHPRTAGFRVYEGREMPAPNPPILDRPTWEAVRALLGDPDRRPEDHPGPERRYLGVGLFVCDRCSVTLNSGYHHASGKRTYRCLTCWRQWRGEPVDEWITAFIEGVISKEDAAERLLPKAPVGGVDVAALAAEADSVRTGMKELAARVATARGATADALAHGLEQGERRLAEIRRLLDEQSLTHPAAEVLLAEDPVAAYRGKGLARQQAIVRSLMDIRLGAPLRGHAKWDARRFIAIVPRNRVLGEDFEAVADHVNCVTPKISA
ncbi:MAG TPA: recombinase family protein [Rugosimonospora sp.]|nr:recombinase family protein [Rugosimonospora sp.]